MLETIEYCPILYTRVAEVKALYFTPSTLKDSILPVLVLRPWQNASHIDFFWNKVTDAIEERPFALDLDGQYARRGDRDVEDEFERLRAHDDGYRNFFEFIEHHSNVCIPVFQLSNASDACLERQIERANAMHRGGVFRCRVGDARALEKLESHFLNAVDNLVVLIDAGWGTRILEHELWAAGIVERVLEAAPETELIIAGSRFPESFSHIEGREEITIQERSLFHAVRMRHNEAHLTYGDWGSTRVPRNSGGGGDIPPRIDWPTVDNWICYRSTDGLSYRDVAAQLVSSSDWDDGNESWGAYIINSTATGAPNAITTPGAAATVRINLHIIAQSSSGDLPWHEEDEPYPDD